MITINGEPKQSTAEPTSLTLFLEELVLPKRFAVVINQVIVPKSQYLDCMVKDGDRIEIIAAVGGG